MHRSYCDIFTAKKKVDVLYLTTSDLGSRDESRGLCIGDCHPANCNIPARKTRHTHIYMGCAIVVSIAVAERIGKPPHFLLINCNIAAHARD